MESSIPVLDVSAISLIHVDPGKSHYDKVGAQLKDAFQTWGFAYLKGHGISSKIVLDCMQTARTFFDLPMEHKETFSRGVERIHGYSAIGREVLENKDIVEFKESFDVHSLDKRQLLGQKEFDGPIQALSHQTVILAQRLLQCLAKDLGIQPKDMLQSHSNMFGQGNATSLRLLHYPPIDLKNSKHQSITRCGEHSDYGGLTLLFQDNHSGLEVRRLDGQWIPVPPIPGTIVVNIGEILQLWSGGRYRATPHRVRGGLDSESTSRYSIATFIHPNNDTIIGPFGSDGMSETNGASKTALDHVEQRFKDTYTP